MNDKSIGNYWNDTGTYEELGKKLDKLIPVGGSVENPKENPKLERYRKMCNAYYDLFCNGGGNSCRRTAYFFPKAIYWANRNNWNECYLITEPIMDKAILLAAKEAGFIDTGGE
tara:strand:- start:214 stop:555 length:342 start_codon:yes stop_codon:yes gene_type:complete